MADREHMHFRECERMAEIVLPALREVARRAGYTLASHGTNRYDIDVVAAPWTDAAIGEEELIQRLIKCLEGITGFAVLNPKDAELKPQGRKAWAIHMGGGPYLDVSVMVPLQLDTSTQEWWRW